MTSPDSLADRVQSYLPPKEILAIKPSVIDIQRRDLYKKTRPGGDFSLVFYQDHLNIVPSWHPLNMTSIAANSSVYGTGSMETLTLEPAPSKEGQANIVLLPPRLTRLYSRALPAREVKPPVGPETLAQGIIDLMAVTGSSILQNSDMGSIRVTVGPGAGKFGKSAVGQPVDLSVEGYGTSRSLPDRPLVVTAGLNQRHIPFLGKHSSHYGDGGRIGQISAELGGDDAIFFAPFEVDDEEQTHTLTQNHPNLEATMMRLALANGLGAELMAVHKNGTLLLSPMRVNRLGGVTAEYIKHYLAPSLGIKTDEQLFSLEEVVSGDITELMLVGNAARISPIGEVIMHDDASIIRTVKLPTPTTSSTLSVAFEAQSTSRLRSSHSTLLTPVDLKTGIQARQILQEEFSSWFD